MKLRTFRCALGPTAVTLHSDHDHLIDYLREFYELAEGEAGPDYWTVEATVGAVEPDMTRNQWGVGYVADPGRRLLRLRSIGAQSLAITTRKCVRETLVDFCERRRYTMLHASAVVDSDRVVVIVGDKGSGKTTLALKSALGSGMRYLSNDHLIIYSTGEASAADTAISQHLALTSLPTPIPLKIGTYLDLEALLPPPWDTEDLDIERHRGLPRADVYGLDRRLLYTFRRFGQDSPTTAELDAVGSGPKVVVVLASYADETQSSPTAVSDPIAALLPHVRTDWMFDRALNQRYMPRSERSEPEYLADARRLVAALCQRATVVAWRHQGDPTPLLDQIGQIGGHA